MCDECDKIQEMGTDRLESITDQLVRSALFLAADTPPLKQVVFTLNHVFGPKVAGEVFARVLRGIAADAVKASREEQPKWEKEQREKKEVETKVGEKLDAIVGEVANQEKEEG